jgi:DNA-binding NarL/FixJ family response regulator
MDGTNTDSEKVEQLTDIFHEITGESSITERQHEDRWASVSADNSDVDADEAIQSIVHEMADEYGIQTSLDEDELATVVRSYHAGEGDRETARTLGTPNRDKTIARARISLHLFRDTDFDAPFELSQLRELLNQDASNEEIADTLSTSKSTVRAYARVLAAEAEAEQASHEYQSRFKQALTDVETDNDDTDQLSETVSPTAYASGLEDVVGSS